MPALVVGKAAFDPVISPGRKVAQPKPGNLPQAHPGAAETIIPSQLLASSSRGSRKGSRAPPQGLLPSALNGVDLMSPGRGKIFRGELLPKATGCERGGRKAEAKRLTKKNEEDLPKLFKQGN